MRWAVHRALETGKRQYVFGYFRWANDGAGLYRVWAYGVKPADAWVDAWPGGCE